MSGLVKMYSVSGICAAPKDERWYGCSLFHNALREIQALAVNGDRNYYFFLGQSFWDSKLDIAVDVAVIAYVTGFISSVFNITPARFLI